MYYLYYQIYPQVILTSLFPALVYLSVKNKHLHHFRNSLIIIMWKYRVSICMQTCFQGDLKLSFFLNWSREQVEKEDSISFINLWRTDFTHMSSFPVFGPWCSIFGFRWGPWCSIFGFRWDPWCSIFGFLCNGL
jgi:hypothetical protein